MEAYFEARNICAAYGEKLVIENLSFGAEKHSLTALIGANGCGKTTLIKSIANRIKHSGNAFLSGECLEALSVRNLAKKISYIPQKSGIDISIPVIDVVLMGFNPELKLLEQPTKEHRIKAISALKEVGLERYVEEDFQNLSAGEKQLVFLARTLIENTSLLLLDEPDSALDFNNRYSILKRIKELVSCQEKAGILCLHDPVLAMEFCEQLVLIKDGRCVSVLKPKEDSLEHMEAALKQIYGDVSLVRCKGKAGKEHLSLLWEDKA